MIQYITGNLLQAPTQALVNTVNTVGVMGKGIALQFKERFPENFQAYRSAVKAGEVQTGKMFVTKIPRLDGEKIIINFPTKAHWRSPSRYEWIEEGLIDLVRVIREKQIKSIAIPPLGCGNGGLDWDRVRLMMEHALQDLQEVDIHIYTPNQQIRQQLATEHKPKKAKLTDARAALLYLMFMYEASGEESSLFIANKLAYFLQRLGEKQLKLRFKRHLYGPYSNQVDHVMYALNGTYITGLEQRTAKAFDRLGLRYEKFGEIQEYVHSQLSESQRARLKKVLQLIAGFESPLSMEALASVDSILEENPTATPEQVYQQIGNWNQRKKNIFSPHHIQVAFKRVQTNLQK